MKKKMAIACIVMAGLMLLSTAYAACPTEEAHRYGSWQTKRSASCRDVGLQFKYCRLCDHWEKRELPKLPHTLPEYEVLREPTCSLAGIKQGKCSECNSVVKQSIETLPHTFGEMEVTKAPTCTESGRGQYVCSVCGGKENEKLAKLGHDFGEMTVTKEPTCHRTGTGDVTCQRCGRKQAQRIDKLEHVYGEWTVTREPEGRSKGVKESVCTLCGDAKTQRFYWEGTLYEDMTPNEDVIRLQEMLRDLGYYKGSIRSGTFGGMTGAAVSRFQRDHGLEGTEIADPQTISLLESEWQKAMGAGEQAGE